jgi:7-cyano-7-deazaguanine synthase
MGERRIIIKEFADMSKLNANTCVVVLSGGQDSTTCLFEAASKHDTVHAITFDYGQRHRRELAAAEIVAQMAGVTSHEVIVVPKTTLLSTSPLVSDSELETYTDFASMDSIIGDRVEKTFVPMRNQLFLTIAANRAVAHGAQSIYTGVCQADNANYPDCRESFIDALYGAINEALGLPLNSSGSMHLVTPLMDMSKADSINHARKIAGAYEALAWTHTAYDGVYPPTGKDHASVLRAHGFEEAGVPDPLVVRAWILRDMELPATANYHPHFLPHRR